MSSQIISSNTQLASNSQTPDLLSQYETKKNAAKLQMDERHDQGKLDLQNQAKEAIERKIAEHNKKMETFSGTQQEREAAIEKHNQEIVDFKACSEMTLKALDANYETTKALGKSLGVYTR